MWLITMLHGEIKLFKRVLKELDVFHAYLKMVAEKYNVLPEVFLVEITPFYAISNVNYTDIVWIKADKYWKSELWDYFFKNVDG